nr:OmpA family protein [Gemmobacter straminiformis]
MAALSSGDYASLRELADWLAANPEARVTLVGHTDASGSVEANTALSQKRADAVREVLVASYGIAPDRIAAKGLGPAAPRASNDTPEGRLKNRRVEVLPTPTR